MARYIFGGRAEDLVVTEDSGNADALILAASVTVGLYDTAGGTLQTDFLLWGGSDYTVPASSIVTSADGILPAFKGPDGLNALYLSDGRVLVSRSGVIATADDIGDGSTKVMMTTTERTKLAGVASGATANSGDATLLARANHTGTQATSTVTGLVAALAEREPTVRWSSGTSTWAARPTGAAAPFVSFKSTDDVTATAPTDPELQVGDVWIYRKS